MPKSNRNCAVGGCSHTQRTCPKGRFVGFPNQDRQPARRDTWIRLVQRGSLWVPTKNSRVCGCHFSGGYKVDDPSDPAYNPSIFPLAPELDRRVKKTLREGFHMRKQKGHQAVQYDESAMTHGLPLQPSNDPTNDSDDIMKFVSAALDLSKEAGEAYALATRTSLPEAPSQFGPSFIDNMSPAVTSTSTSTAGCQLSATVAGKPQHQDDTHSTRTAAVPLTTGNTRQQLTIRDQLTPDTRVPQTNSQDHGWVYFNQPRNTDSAINLASDSSNEYTLRRKRQLHANKLQHGARFQRFAATNRRMLGNLASSKPPRGMQQRYIAKTTSSSTVDKGKTTDAPTVQKSLANDNLSGNLQMNAEIPLERKKVSCDTSAQTILSMEPQDDSMLGLSKALTPLRGRCHGFHGWSDVCFSANTVDRIAGVTQDIFDLLLVNLPIDLPGLPPHNCLLLFLMKLKMAVPFEFLASVFGITAPTACNIFTHLLSLLISTLSDLIRRPFISSTPTQNSQNDSNVKLNTLIDCLDIRIAHQDLPEYLPKMFCNVSGEHCAKIIVGILPNGLISFISDAYVGSTKTIDIFANSDILNSLVENKTVLLLQNDTRLKKWLLTKGFKVASSSFQSVNQPVASTSNKSLKTCADFKPPINIVFPEPVNENEQEPTCIPPSTTVSEINFIPPAATVSEVMLIPSAATVTEVTLIPPAATISEVNTEQPLPDHCGTDSSPHICARNVAHRLRSFSILTSTLEGSLLPYIDDVVLVCAALSNLQEPVSVTCT